PHDAKAHGRIAKAAGAGADRKRCGRAHTGCAQRAVVSRASTRLFPRATMSNPFKSLPRRTFLRGAGAALALPLLDAMSPALAATPKAPARLAFLYVPNGIDMANWNVAADGPLPRELPRVLAPLAPFRGDILQLGNLTHNSGRALLDGPGDHAR